uniref:NIDO domain-containing protein n=2 Tax=Clytia hemisphaerica TaxID=252671 RepID=A0A7M5WR58_9CNID
MAIVVKLLLMVLLVRNCEGSVNELFYPFGDQWNDTTLVGASFYNTFYSVMQLHVPFRSSNRLFIYDSGYVSTDLQTKENPTVNHGIFLYSGFFSSKVGSVSHRQTRNEPVVNKMIEDDLRRYKDHKEPNMKDFVPKNTIIITYYQTYRYLSTQRNVFQAILTYNDQDAYLITNYYVLENAGATVAQTYNGCTHTFAPTFNSNNLQYNTNIGVQGRYVWNVNDVDCEAEKKRYITEDLDGVQILPKGDDVVEKITLSQPMPLFHGLKSEFLLSSDGYLTTCSDNTTLNTHHIRYMWYDYLAFFANDFNVTDESRGTILYYETTTNQELLNRTAADITFFTWRDFKPLHAFVVSYVNCSDKKDRVINFDAIIVTDGYDTYFIFKYFNENFISDVWSFYSSKHCNWDIMGVVGTRWTNTGRTGSSVFKVYDHACMTQVFLPYGSHIDTVKTVADETNFHVYLTKSMPLFTKIGKTLYVNSNGKISYTRDSRYGEAQCNTGHLIVPYSQGELELYGYEINPRVFKLTKEQCKDEIDAYLYPFGKEHGDQVLLYNSSTSMVPFKVQNVLNLFGSEVDTLHISKYGFLSLNEQPADEIVWYPYNKTKIIYGYLTNLPSNV